MKKNIKIFSVVFFLYLNTISIFPQSDYLIMENPQQVTGYKGVKIYLDENFIKNYQNFLIKGRKRAKYKYDKVQDIFDALDDRFHEMKEYFDKGKHKLPSCLRKKLNDYFEELRNGTRNLIIYWDVMVYKDSDRNIYNFRNLPDQISGEGESPIAGKIIIRDAYKFKHTFGNRKVMTASLLFHELIHNVKQAYPLCFNELELKKMEEYSTEDGQILVFGWKNSSNPYQNLNKDLDVGSKENDCTYKIVCRCKPPDCPCEVETSMQSNISEDCCDPECPKKEEEIRDTPDDNYSFSEGVIKIFNIAPESVIFSKGMFRYAVMLFGGLRFDGKNTAEELLNVTKYLIIPTDALAERQNDSTLKYILKEYVKLGGTILVLTQQYGRYFSEVVPVPEGEFLRSYGWREDQSCLHGSLYTKKVHPILSSLTKEQVSAAVDGYFDICPSNSTKLLIRTKNNEPALIMYPYGDNGGHVILTSLYTDWGYGHSQATTEELKLVRDLVTFARNPGLPIPMYNVSDNPTPEINLSVKVKNNTEDPAVTATKVKFKITTPDRSSVLYETEQGVSLTLVGENIITNMSGNML